MLGRLKRLAGWLVSGRQAGLFQLVNGAQLDDFEFFRAGRCRNFYFIPDLAVEERAADRRRRRNMALFDVSFFAAYQTVFDANVALRVNNDNSGAVARTVPGDVAEVEQAQVAQAFFELADARVDETLAFFGVFVLGILGKVAMRPRHCNFLGQLDAQLVFELVDLFLQLLLHLRDGVGHAPSPNRSQGDSGALGCPQEKTVVLPKPWYKKFRGGVCLPPRCLQYRCEQIL